MKRRLIMLVALIAIASGLLFTPTTPTKAQDEAKNCDLTASICRTISSNLYLLCMATRADTGKTESDCTWDAANYTLECMSNNGCTPVLN